MVREEHGSAHLGISQRTIKVHMCMVARKNRNKSAKRGYKDFLVENMAKTKILVEKKLIKIDSEWYKTYFKMKISISKLLPLGRFSGDIANFSKNWGHRSKKWQRQKFR